jgi:hypothetical protein
LETQLWLFVQEELCFLPQEFSPNPWCWETERKWKRDHDSFPLGVSPRCSLFQTPFDVVFIIKEMQKFYDVVHFPSRSRPHQLVSSSRFSERVFVDVYYDTYILFGVFYDMMYQFFSHFPLSW